MELCEECGVAVIYPDAHKDHHAWLDTLMDLVYNELKIKDKMPAKPERKLF